MDPSGKYRDGGTLMISPSGLDTKIIYDGTDIKDFIYSNECLFWSASQGNAVSASLSFYINSTQTKSNSVPGVQFSVRYCVAGEKPPSRPNIFGLVGKTEDPASASRDALAMSMWRSAGVNLTVGVAAIQLGKAVLEYNRSFVTWIDSPDVEHERPLQKADEDTMNRYAEVMALAREPARVYPGTGFPAAGLWLPPGLAERWSTTALGDHQALISADLSCRRCAADHDHVYVSFRGDGGPRTSTTSYSAIVGTVWRHECG